MMNKTEFNPLARFKYLLFVPLVFALMAMNGFEARAHVQKVVTRKKSAAKKPSPYERFECFLEPMASFPGGDMKLIKYIAENVTYPIEAVKAKQQGRVIVSFVVEKDGSLSNFKVARSVSPALDAEALRVMKGMPKWIPGKEKGKPVRMTYNVPVSFKLN